MRSTWILCNPNHHRNAGDLAATSDRQGSAGAAGLEVAALLGATLWVLWTDSKHVLTPAVRPIGPLLLALIAGTLLWRQPPRQRELADVTALREGLASLFSFTVFAALALLAVGALRGGLHAPPNLLDRAIEAAPLELAQQAAMLLILAPRIGLWTGNHPTRSLASASLFSLLHAPNLLLMVITLPAGFFWCEWHRRNGNLLAVWFSHLSLAVALRVCLPDEALRSLRVGVGYFFWRG